MATERPKELMGNLARQTLRELEARGKAKRLDWLQNHLGDTVIERWQVGKFTGILFANVQEWEFYTPIVPVDAENATLSAIEHMAEAE